MDRGPGEWWRNVQLPSSCSLTLSFLYSFPFSFISIIISLSLVPIFCRLFSSDSLFVIPHFSLSLALAQLCLLMMCLSLAVFPFGFGDGRKTLVPSQALIFYVDWALIIYDSKLCITLPPPSPSSTSSHFLSLHKDFSSYFCFFLLSHTLGGLLQLFGNRLLCCCWLLESEGDPGLTCGKDKEGKFSICSHSGLVLSLGVGWMYIPLG